MKSSKTKVFVEQVPYSDKLKELLAEMESFVTENRLTNVVSHVGEVTFPKDFGKVMGLFAKDIYEDFVKEFHAALDGLDKCEQKSFTKELNKAATSFVKEIYMSRAYVANPEELV